MTDNASPLAPAGSSRSNLTSHVNATSAITGYCHALRNTTLRPASDPPAGWFKPFSDQLAAAQQHAQSWITTLGPKVTSQAPQALIDFGDTFAAATGDVLDILQKSQNQPSSMQVDEINQLLGALATELAAQKKSVVGLQDQLRTFTDDLIEDHKNLAEGASDALHDAGVDAEQVMILQAMIGQVQLQIQHDSQAALESEVGLGVALFITVAFIAFALASGGTAAPLVGVGIGVVGVGGAIAGTVIFSDKVKADIQQLYQLETQLGDEVAQIAALIAITNSLDGLVAQNAAAQQALSDILTEWETLEEKLQAVIDEVKKAKNEVAPILTMLDLQTAQTEWQQLVDFATMAQETAASVTVAPMVAFPPASQAA